jgi:hypothetical protein
MRRAASHLQRLGRQEHHCMQPRVLPAKSNLIEFRVFALRVNGIDSTATGHWTIECHGVFSVVSMEFER